MIIKVVVTKSAIFDYEEIVCNMPMNRTIKEEIEKILAKNPDENRLRFFDERSQKELLLFIRKGYFFGPMQVYILEGICEACDYAEWMEEEVIPAWLSVEIE